MLSSLLATSCAALAQTQSFQPKTIQFKGDSEYTDAELASAAGLKPDQSLTAGDLNDHAKLLIDTGLFEDITFHLNGQDLIFEVVPARDRYPIRLVNLPMADGKELDDRLHALFPLYHGKVPTQGGLLEAVRKELEEELAGKGIQATIASSAYVDPKLDQITAVNLSISNPAVVVGEIEITGASPEQASKARILAAKEIGSEFNTHGSVNQLEANLLGLYRDRGYLDAAVHVVAKPSLVVNDEGVHVPLSVTVDEGPQYKLAGVKLAPGLLVTQEAFDKQSEMHAGQVLSLETVRQNWIFIVRQYHDKGFMKARLIPTATVDHAKGTIGYTVTVETGPVYTMGAVRVPNASDDLREALLGEWKIAPGAVFNESAIQTLAAAPSLARLFAIGELRYTLSLHDDVHTVDVDLRLERKLP